MIDKKIKCIFVHGWGMNRMVWQPLVDTLPDWIEPVSVDLPGHGDACDVTFNELNDLVQALAEQIEAPAIWLGWSLGGLAVMQLALQYPEKVKAMMLVASSPCFVHKDEWTCGMDGSVFTAFADELEKDFSGTIRRFLTLQVRGSESGRRVLKDLREKILAQSPANIQALRAGLDVLKTTDLRDQLKQFRMPVSWVLGERDGLIKSTLIEELNVMAPDVCVSVYNNAAHAPFLSHLEKFSEQLISFVKDHS